MTQPSVCIHESLEYELQCRRISARYSLPRVSDSPEKLAEFALRYQDDVLKLWDLQYPKFRPVFVKVSQTGRIQKNSLLGKAMGRKTSTVVDATAGLGGDALLLARMGFDVTAIERMPVVSALLEDGIARAKTIEQRLQIQHQFGDAKDMLPKMSTPPDSIYLDPMYPEGRKKSVEVARPLKILRELVGDDSDFVELLEVALSSTAKRVVVKRPCYAEPVYLRELAGSLKGKMVRYDIYVRMT